jgi:hypothetical protein
MSWADVGWGDLVAGLASTGGQACDAVGRLLEELA